MNATEKQQTKPRSLCVCMPGPSFSSTWMQHWDDLYIHLLSHFHLRKTWGWGNNIYLVREGCLQSAMGMDPNGPPDLILWLDSDNPPELKNFELLLAAMDASEEVSIVGGWYRYFNPFTLQVYIAAGWRDRNVTEAELIEADHLVEVDYVGFGMCLMRRKVIEDIGIEDCFSPLRYRDVGITPKPGGREWATDDDGFGQRAKYAGHRVFVHPAVFSHHEKQMNVPGSFEGRNETPQLKEL